MSDDSDKWVAIVLTAFVFSAAVISFAPTPEKELMYTCMQFENMMYVNGDCIPQTNEGISE